MPDTNDMANKKKAAKAARKANRVVRKGEKVQRVMTKLKHNGTDPDSRNEDVNQAAARILRQATEK